MASTLLGSKLVTGGDEVAGGSAYNAVPKSWNPAPSPTTFPQLTD